MQKKDGVWRNLAVGMLIAFAGKGLEMLYPGLSIQWAFIAGGIVGGAIRILVYEWC